MVVIAPAETQAVALHVEGQARHQDQVQFLPGGWMVDGRLQDTEGPGGQVFQVLDREILEMTFVRGNAGQAEFFPRSQDPFQDGVSVDFARD